MSRKIGIFSGTFDPIHDGHLSFAKAARNALGLDKVVFLPEETPRSKTSITDVEHRLQMLRLATASDNHAIVLKLPVSRFTFDSVMPILYEKFTNAEFYLLMGEDVFAGVGQWPKIDHYKSILKFVVGRSTDKSFAPGNGFNGLQVNYIDHSANDQSSSNIRSSEHLPIESIRGYTSEHNLYN